MNPNYNCTFGSGYQMQCTGGKPFLNTNGWVYSEYFENRRFRETCDYFSEMTIYLQRPSINCSGRYCNIRVNYSSSPNDIRVSAEITTYDKRGRYLGREDDDEADYSPFGSTDLTIRIDDDVERVVLTDVGCEKW